MTEDEMVQWHHQLNGHEFEQALGDGENKKVWHYKESDMTESLNKVYQFLIIVMHAKS